MENSKNIINEHAPIRGIMPAIVPSNYIEYCKKKQIIHILESWISFCEDKLKVSPKKNIFHEIRRKVQQRLQNIC